MQRSPFIVHTWTVSKKVDVCGQGMLGGPSQSATVAAPLSLSATRRLTRKYPFARSQYSYKAFLETDDSNQKRGYLDRISELDKKRASG